ncbi:MAG: type IX secretion system membrane protein PorP/SprF [Cyclobacteriaceae bacterium]|nr:type IX secretion system membrane protein PorP/SprF [Cyclobacteriaceae bacterium]
MRKVLLLSFLFILFYRVEVSAQDPQFSQFYAAPLYLNPAFAGSTEYTRVGLNYRNQWPSFGAQFVTSSVYADHYLEDYNSGIGMMLTYDKEGLAGRRIYNVGFVYSYQMRINDWITFRPGVQVSYARVGVNPSGLVFGDQIDPSTGIVVPTTGESLSIAGVNMFDLGFGGMLYTKDIFLGASLHHVTKPNQSINGGVDPLPMKMSIHGGYKYRFNNGTMGSGLYARPQERSLTPTAQYKKQGEFNQMDLGMYLTLEPIIFGMWYRGLPFKKFNELSNNESIVMLIGFVKRGKDDVLNVGYSYDYTISALGAGSGGAHEFTISYQWSTRDPRKPPKHVMQIPCPNF